MEIGKKTVGDIQFQRCNEWPGQTKNLLRPEICNTQSSGASKCTNVFFFQKLSLHPWVVNSNEKNDILQGFLHIFSDCLFLKKVVQVLESSGEI